MKESTHNELDSTLAEWSGQVRIEGIPVSGPKVAAKAKFFFDLLSLG